LDGGPVSKPSCAKNRHALHWGGVLAPTGSQNIAVVRTTPKLTKVTRKCPCEMLSTSLELVLELEDGVAAAAAAV
jgi:hypothetical protein